MNKLLPLLLAALFAPSLHAQQTIRFQPEPDFEELVGKGVSAYAPRDAFSSSDCGVVDARNVRPYSLAEASAALAPCLASVSKRYGIPLAVKPGIVETTPEGKAVIGLVLSPREAAAGTTASRDLNHALARRSDRLMGYRAVLRRQGEAGPRVMSLAQEALGRCILPAVLRKIRSASDFLGVYGGCLLKDSELKAVAVRPLGGDPLAVALVSSAEKPVVESLNGLVEVMAEDGPVSVLIAGFSR